jgi:thiol-disulfide isomerase/thioredoxin
MKKTCLAVFASVISIVSLSQGTGFNVTRIGIGDQVPGKMPLNNLINYSKPNATIADFKGKWLILDYWFTGCGPCIASWPNLMQLQKKYGDKIQILGVNHMEGHQAVKDFIRRKNSNSKEPFTLPTVTGDTILFKILPPFGYPSIVWIDPEGIYRGSTSGSDLNDKTVQSVLDNQTIQSLATNTSFVNFRRPLFLDGNGGSGQQMLFYSTVSKYSDKIPSGIFLMSADSSGYVIAASNKPIVDLIASAYCNGPFINSSSIDYVRLPRTRMAFEGKHAEKLIRNQTNHDNWYSYQLISYQPRTIEQLKEIMRHDLQQYFGLRFQWKKTRKECLVLTSGDTTLLGDSSIGETIYGEKDGVRFIRDMPVEKFISMLTEFIGGVYSNFGGYPLINETGFTGGLDLVFEGVTDENERAVLGDYQKLNTILKRYGMRFSVQQRDIDILVISEATPSNNFIHSYSQNNQN